MNENEQNRTKKESEPRITTAMRQILFLTEFAKSNFHISDACEAAGISRGTYYLWTKKKKFKAELDALHGMRGDMVERALYENAVVGKDVIAQIFFCKTILKDRGYYEGEPVVVGGKPNESAVELLAELIEGTRDVKTIALEFAKAGIPLPEAISILLKKEPAEEDFDDDTAGMLSEEELEERGRTAMEEHDRQVSSFVPERKAEIEEIKEELKEQDSFSEENVPPEDEM